jgi:hypothetical protein
MNAKSASQTKIRYAVVALGRLAQVAIIPAFAHAENSVIPRSRGNSASSGTNAWRPLPAVLAQPRLDVTH